MTMKNPINATFKTLLTLLAFGLSSPSLADSGLGFENGALSFSGQKSASRTQLDGALQMDHRVSNYHGLQTEVTATTYEGFWVGSIGAHLYMNPSDGAKYGLFAAYMDRNDRSDMMMSLGIEGLWNVSDTVIFGARAGLGLYQPNHVDFIFTDLHLDAYVSPTLRLGAGLSLSRIQELGYTREEMTPWISARYRLGRGPFSAVARLSHQHLREMSGRRNEVQLTLGIRMELGDSATADGTLFAPIQPISGYVATR